jgi:uncharacterized protein YdeI (YjbR/CyaY-like superfamily)
MTTPKARSSRPALATLERVNVASRAELRRWLANHHQTSPGAWVVTWKRGRGPHVSWDEVVEELLCVGWIDSRPAKLDADRSMLLCTPRKPTSAWSAINKARVERLVAAGLMKRPGLAMVELARRTGTWAALDEVEALREPDDLTAALDARPTARQHWDGFPRSVKRGILDWIRTAKRPETRAGRVTETVTEAAAGRRANQWRQPAADGPARPKPPRPPKLPKAATRRA